MAKLYTLGALAILLGVTQAEELLVQANSEQNVASSKEVDLKPAASERFFDLGSKYTPATVYGAPGGGFYPSTGYSGYSGYSGYPGSGYNNYNGYPGSGYNNYGYTSPGYTGSGYNNVGYTGNGYNTAGYNYNRPYYSGNGGYGGYQGNGGLFSYSGYNSPSYSGYNNNLGYGYYNTRGLGSTYYNRGFGGSGYGGVTPSYISGYRGYS